MVILLIFVTQLGFDPRFPTPKAGVITGLDHYVLFLIDLVM